MMTLPSFPALLPTLALAVAATACAAPTDAADPTECVLAAESVAACVGTEIETPFSPACEPDEAQRARELVEQLEVSGCEGPTGGKSDGFFCDLWDPLGWCDDPAPVLGAEPTGRDARYPILLAHGFNTSTTNFWRFNDVDRALEEDGHDAYLGSVPPFDTPMVRATYLAQQVDAILLETGADKINLICFSQGGVDCRYLVSPGGLDYGDRVASVSLISAPNRGTYVADVAIAALPESDSWLGGIVDVMTSWYGGTFSELAEDSHFIDAMRSMSEEAMVGFNETVVDHPDVHYQSWAGFSYVAGLPNPRENLDEVCRDDEGVLRMMWHEGTRDVMNPLLVGGALFVGHGTDLRMNDGVSTVESSHWGVFRGCIPGDHLDQVGQIDADGPDRRTGFDYLRFYRNIAFELAEMGY